VTQDELRDAAEAQDEQQIARSRGLGAHGIEPLKATKRRKHVDGTLTVNYSMLLEDVEYLRKLAQLAGHGNQSMVLGQIIAFHRRRAEEAREQPQASGA
jgi:hypothetical protein